MHPAVRIIAICLAALVGVIVAAVFAVAVVWFNSDLALFIIVFVAPPFAFYCGYAVYRFTRSKDDVPPHFRTIAICFTALAGAVLGFVATELIRVYFRLRQTGISLFVSATCACLFGFAVAKVTRPKDE
ncbi:MAG: hypothetical protein AB7O26_13630 [Planctomycetaceae bacterium]